MLHIFDCCVDSLQVLSSRGYIFTVLIYSSTNYLNISNNHKILMFYNGISEFMGDDTSQMTAKNLRFRFFLILREKYDCYAYIILKKITLMKEK
jgi:hypothetical protein